MMRTMAITMRFPSPSSREPSPSLRSITLITSALVSGTGLCLIISSDRFDRIYEELGILLPGMTEDLLDLHHHHGDWLLPVLAAAWILKDRHHTGMRNSRLVAICGLVAATLLPLLVVVAILLPLVKITRVIGVEE